jgi:haloacetate dehalogenase
MLEETSRRSLLQKSALAAGVVATKQLLAQQSGSDASAEPAWKRMFPAGFKNEKVKTTGATINVVTGGEGPPLLLMHGAPQSLITWRLIAPDLAKDYKLVMIDLRGYGDSSKPEDQPDHSSQSKRPMALDGVEVMQHFGYQQFRVVGHDRGGRVGRRMALDHPDKVQKLAVFDIVPAHYLYSHFSIEFVEAYPHWFVQLQRSPIPENQLIAQYQAQAARATTDEAREYSRVNLLPGFAHAMCEDYRASASIDLKIDEADIKAGKKIQCPLLTLWAATGAMGKLYDVLKIWKDEGVNVSGKGLPGNHSLQESAPRETLAELQQFLRG